jgi:hypothetical protein
MFLSPLQHVPLPFTEQSVLYNDLKIRCNKQVWNKILNIKPCGGQISVTMELLICEYWSKSIIIGEQILTEKDRQRVTKASPFGRNKAISLKPGRKNPSHGGSCCLYTILIIKFILFIFRNWRTRSGTRWTRFILVKQRT